jgi:hypothetical protein
MQTRLLVALLCSCAAASAVRLAPAMAETIVVDDQVKLRDSAIETPKRGITMTQVEAHFGAPATRHDAVGAPPITRWDYPTFSVFFEHDRVIHAVATTGQAAVASRD